jgi:uncharacterized protein YlzI (FlbEa/FlbD family)
LKLPRTSAQFADMALVKLNRINKGGEIVINSEHITFIEVESRSTTVHTTGSLFSVEESMSMIVEKIEAMETARITKGIDASGLAARPSIPQL